MRIEVSLIRKEFDAEANYFSLSHSICPVILEGRAESVRDEFFASSVLFLVTRRLIIYKSTRAAQRVHERTARKRFSLILVCRFLVFR